MKRPNLYLDVEVYAGRNIASAIKEMIQLADRLGIDVWSSLNGVRTMARPGADHKKLHAAWDDALENKKGIASA